MTIREDRPAYLVNDYTHDENRFYHSSAWKRVRDEVLALDHYECQMCKQEGRLTHQTKKNRNGVKLVVHHVKHLRDRPDLALSVYDGDERQLITVCDRCHNRLHPEKGRQGEEEKIIWEEFW